MNNYAIFFVFLEIEHLGRFGSFILLSKLLSVNLNNGWVIVDFQSDQTW